MMLAELHRFADAQFISGGYTHFLWSTFEGDTVPVLNPAFGIVVSIDGLDPAPGPYARYNPITDAWSAALADDAVPSLMPFHQAQWNNTQWIIAPSGA